jgi:SAM-dependent methyltransferase
MLLCQARARIGRAPWKRNRSFHHSQRHRHDLIHHSHQRYQCKSNHQQHCHRAISGGGSQSSCICGLLQCIPDACPALHAGNWSILDETKHANLAPYQGSPWEAIDTMLDLACIKPGDRLVDLGAGDGRVLIRAVQRGVAYAEGWELNNDAFALGQQHINQAFPAQQQAISRLQRDASTPDNPRLKCRLFHGDAMQADLFSFQIVTLFLLPVGLNALQPWLSRHLEIDQGVYRPTLSAIEGEGEGERDDAIRIVSQGWPVPGWTPAVTCPHSSGLSAPCYMYSYKKKKRETTV